MVISPVDSRQHQEQEPSTWHRLGAWAVHAYTALGLLLALAMAILIVDGSPPALRLVFICMLAATVIDATDGTLARWAQVKQVLPGFDGRRLDDLIDFLTYAFFPLLLLWRCGVLPEPAWLWIALPLLAAGYGFSQTHAKTADGYFLGFPSYWNVVAFYLYLMPWPGWVAVTLLQALAVLTFIPLRYLYPSQGGRLNRWTCFLGAVWAAAVLWLLWKMPTAQHPFSLPSAEHPTLGIAYLSLGYPGYYLFASWLVDWRQRRRKSGT